MPVRMEIDTRDILRAQRALMSLGQPQLRTTTSRALSAAARVVVVPEMQGQIRAAARGKSPRRPAGFGAPKRGTQGPLAKSVRPKQLPKRYAGAGASGEMVAIGVGPRAWYKHWFIKGTQAHTTRGPRGTYRMDGHGSAIVPPQGLAPWHPGARPHDVVTATGRAVAPRVATTLGGAILDSFSKQMARKP